MNNQLLSILAGLETLVDSLLSPTVKALGLIGATVLVLALAMYSIYGRERQRIYRDRALNTFESIGE